MVIGIGRPAMSRRKLRASAICCFEYVRMRSRLSSRVLGSGPMGGRPMHFLGWGATSRVTDASASSTIGATIYIPEPPPLIIDPKLGWMPPAPPNSRADQAKQAK